MSGGRQRGATRRSRAPVAVNYESVYRSNEIAALTVHDRLCRQCGVLRIFPSIPIESVRAILGEPMKGVVLETYGERQQLWRAIAA